MSKYALILVTIPALALSADSAIEHFMVGRWTILFDESLSRYEQQSAAWVSDDLRSRLKGPWMNLGDFDVSSSTITFYRPSGQHVFSYEVLGVTGDAIALRVYHNHEDFQLSLKRDGAYLCHGAGLMRFPRRGLRS